ncbi:hypothetical protein [Microbulbifer epialgicus]|uniref:Uncharacterized protein n=1 Tax=Microbulbifer epialgicus TaxID=393907 RepID=A0ABV4P6F3_9GAMM
MSDYLSNDTRGVHKIAHDKLVFGIKANIDAAATGFIQNLQDLYIAFDQLAAEGQPLRGVMTGSLTGIWVPTLQGSPMGNNSSKIMVGIFMVRHRHHRLTVIQQ